MLNPSFTLPYRLENFQRFGNLNMNSEREDGGISVIVGSEHLTILKLDFSFILKSQTQASRGKISMQSTWE